MNSEYGADSEHPRIPERAVAVVGMNGRFPGARTLDEYWSNLRAGVCSIRDFTAEELAADGVDPAESADPAYVASKGYLEDADRFEAELFGFTPPQAAALDPQHRLLLETAWATLEDAGYDPRAVPVRTGVYVGGGATEHHIAASADRNLAGDLGTLNVRLLTDKDFLASWISYRLDLEGPSLVVQAACATSLAAVHTAVQSLLLGECDLALAGGVAVDHLRREGYLYRRGGISSPDGRCRPFAEDSAGTVRGNGVGLVALRRLEDALADGDPIRAVIRGSAAVNDGAAKIGFTAPSVQGQAAAMSEALSAADVGPASVGYIEMHGTATALGDRIEAAATISAYAEAEPSSIVIGAVKANLGHLDAAAGIAGLIKTVLMLEHRSFVPLVNVRRADPELKLDSSPLRLSSESGPWPAPEHAPRRAAVSSVGLGGNNVHVILEETPSAEPRPPLAEPAAGADGPSSAVLLPISARTPEQAATLASRLADRIEADPTASVSLRDLATTAHLGRAGLAARGFVVAGDRAEAVRGLRALAAAGRFATVAETGGPIFVFPGQASQYPGMGRELYERFAPFRAAMDRCAGLLRETHGLDPRSWSAADGHANPDPRGRTDYWQPAIFAVEYATSALLRESDVEPAAMVGHSIGEYVAACLAGVISLEDALWLVAERGRLMARTAPGAMAAVFASADAVRDLLIEGTDLAAVNGPGSCVVSGPHDRVRALMEHLDAHGIEHRDLQVDYGFHSPLMDEVVEEFAALAARTDLRAPREGAAPYVSTVTGTWITGEQSADPSYWAGQIRRPVLFGPALATALGAGSAPVVEVGPGVALSGNTRRAHPGQAAHATLGKNGTEAVDTLRALGALWSLGLPVNGSALSSGRRVHLPTYPFAGSAYGAMTLRPPASASVAAPAQTHQDQHARSTAAAEPASTEARIAEVLRQTLGVSEPDDLTSSYLDAGGESLTAVHLIGRLRDEFGLEVPIALLLEPIPLRTLAERIATEDAAAQGLFADLLDELEAEQEGETGA